MLSNEELFKTLRTKGRELNDWLKENCPPDSKIIITAEEIKLVQPLKTEFASREDHETGGMEWEQDTSTRWIARGKDGAFIIALLKGKFLITYASFDTHFNLPPTRTLADAQAACENSEYWEDAK